MSTPQRKRPLGGGRGFRKRIGGGIDYRAIAGSRPAIQADPVDLLLSRLDSVRAYGKGWRADCPIGHSSRGSLSVTADGNGCILLHCFNCHDTPGILAALGLELADLYPRRITHATAPQERRELRQRAKECQWAAALTILAAECVLVLIVASDVAAGRTPPADDLERLRLAVARIEAAKGTLQ